MAGSSQAKTNPLVPSLSAFLRPSLLLAFLLLLYERGLEANVETEILCMVILFELNDTQLAYPGDECLNLLLGLGWRHGLVEHGLGVQPILEFIKKIRPAGGIKLKTRRRRAARRVFLVFLFHEIDKITAQLDR